MPIQGTEGRFFLIIILFAFPRHKFHEKLLTFDVKIRGFGAVGRFIELDDALTDLVFFDCVINIITRSATLG